MKPTDKLYFTDSSILDFEANVLEISHGTQGYQVILDRTGFYPTGGGQPNDLGMLGGASVIDVVESDAGIVHHIVDELSAIAQGTTVSGRVDRTRRLDHLQQHSGQHILSQAFIQACGAETRSFHLGPSSSTIDIELQSPSEALIRSAEEIANAVVFDDRPMRVHMVNDEEAARLPLRKESAVHGTIRVIEIEDFDWSPCGGTHAARTGQVGLIAVRSYERAKKMTRVEFVCGGRALEDYRLANNTAVRVARLFSADRDSSPELVAKAIEENKELKRRTHGLLELAMTAEALQSLATVPSTRGFKLVHAVFDRRDFEEVRLLASKIAAAEPAIALLATKQPDGARLVFARSTSLTADLGKVMNEACAIVGGRGGGRPDIAQGGGPNSDKIGQAIEMALRLINTAE
ncbi:MAG: DHHA1 domain-containing protein [Acidobacteriota bacterium]